MRQRRCQGFTLLEALLTFSMLLISAIAILSAQQALVQLSDHARNYALANNDAQRVIEEIRRHNTPCGSSLPAALSPTGTSWNAWLADTSPSGGGGKSLPVGMSETIAVSCRSRDNNAFCTQDQISSGEWQYPQSPASGSPAQNPMRLTVSVCWMDNNRVFGECRQVINGGVTTLVPDDSLSFSGLQDVSYVIDSPASTTTLITCRS